MAPNNLSGESENLVCSDVYLVGAFCAGLSFDI